MPLISVFGFLSAFISAKISVNFFIPMFLIFGVLVVLSYYFSGSKGRYGGTAEMTYLLVYVLGALVFWGYLLLAAKVAVIAIILLTFKAEFRKFAGKLEEEDLYAVIKLAIITIIVLPLLPDRTFDPYKVINPGKIWYFVVFIAGINFIGFV